MTMTAYSALPPEAQVYYDKRFELKAKPSLLFYDNGQKRPMPKGEGGTVYFKRYLPKSARTTAITEATDGGITPSGMTSQEFTATVLPYGDYDQLTLRAKMTMSDQDLREATDVQADQMALTIDTLIRNTVCAKIDRIRADNDTTYSVSGTADSGTVTTLVDDALTQIDDYWNGGFITITAGTNYGMTRQVSDFVASSDTLTFAAFPKAMDTTSVYHLVVGTGLVATDIINNSNVKLAVRQLRRAKVLTYEGGFFYGYIDEDTEYDFLDDTKFVAVGEYQDSSTLKSGEIGKWGGVKWIRHNNAFRESTAGVQGDTAAVRVVPIFGSNAYGVVNLEGGEKKIYVRTWDQLGQPLPLYHTIGWEAYFTSVVLNSCFAVGIMAGATA